MRAKLCLLDTLEVLDVSDNHLTRIPPGIANLDSLKVGRFQAKAPF